MAWGLVSSIIEGNDDSRTELATIKQHLTSEIAHLVPVQIGPYSQPQTAYANAGGKTILGSLQRLEMQVQGLIEKTECLQDELTQTNEELRDLRKEVTVLRPLKDSAVAIRRRFYANFTKNKMSNNQVNTAVIEAGNVVAHCGDVVTDVCLHQSQLVCYNNTFKTLYGLPWEGAKVLIRYPHMVSVMDHRATIIAKRSGRWTTEDQFRALAVWTRKATPEDLAKFRADDVGRTPEKRLYFKIMYGK
ncbi:hypothetical protein HOY80DRAFT_1033698 [Tuber brumale]|nr:hypothetical protein HOY80DRAFT_1033698 [Tuber brumale]